MQFYKTNYPSSIIHYPLKDKSNPSIVYIQRYLAPVILYKTQGSHIDTVMITKCLD